MWSGGLVDFFFPRRCGGCAARGDWFCDRCREGVRPAVVAGCLRCGRRSTISPCPLCDETRPILDELVAPVLLQGAVREAIHRMKYGDRPQLAGGLAVLWRDWVPPSPRAVLVPVPLGPVRQRQRGYNQALELARRLAGDRDLELVDGLRREVDTGPQVGRGGDVRRSALQGVFTWRGRQAPDSVVLVDDVVTTGATLMECGRACRRAGATAVYGLALAVG